MLTNQKSPGIVQEKSASNIEEDLGAIQIKDGGMFEGLPYRGPPIITKDNDPDYKQPQLTYQGHAKVFNMADPEDSALYSELMDKKVRGYIDIGQQRITYDKDLKTYMIFFEWCDIYYTAPSIID